MNQNSDSQDHPKPAPALSRQTFWQKLGGGSLTIAVLFHVILLVIGAFWVFQIIQQPEKKVDFMPPGGGGGERGAEHKIQQKKQQQITPQTNVKRVFAEGAVASYSIPEQGDNFGEMSALSSLSGGGMSGGLGGSGSGSGFGKGNGTGGGLGTGAGSGKIFGPASLFGMTDPNAKGLEGTLYDAKQSPRKKPNNLSPQEMGELLRDFTSRGWNERTLSTKYFQAEQKLYLTQVYMPLMAAGGAPKAFQCEKDVQPSRWLIVYRGTVIAPKTGKFRFVGASDDSLAVRFNGQNVFDHGFHKATKGLRRSSQEKVEIYQYPNSPHYNSCIGGYEAGIEFDVRAGSSYPIEILISEIPGGYFGAALMIQEMGVAYSKTQTGAPLLPLFRTDSSQPVEAKGGNVPPFDPNGPVWESAKRAGRLDI